LSNKAAVREAKRPSGGANFNLPQTASGPLFESAVAVGMATGVGDGDLSLALFVAAAKAVALGLF